MGAILVLGMVAGHREPLSVSGTLYFLCEHTRAQSLRWRRLAVVTAGSEL
jgi:hypothetical protein